MEENMDEKPAKWNDIYASWTSTKTDEWLVEAWKNGDRLEKDVAGQILDDRYRSKLIGWVSRKLPNDWVEATVQQIWEEFYGYVKLNQIKSRVGSLLFGIARNVRADSVDKLTQERQVERGVLARESWESLQIESHIEELEEFLVKREQLAFIAQLPFSDKLLSDCQWVLWKLRKNLGYSTPSVARLLGKSREVVYASLWSAKTRLKAYLESDRFYADMALNREEPTAGYASLKATPFGRESMTLEWFTNPIQPELNAEELRPLGLTTQELESEYRVSLWLPVFANMDKPSEDNQKASEPMLLLTPRSDWQEIQNGVMEWYTGARRKPGKQLVESDSSHFRRMRYPGAQPEYKWTDVVDPLFDGTTTYMIGIEVKDENIILQPEGMVILQTGPDDSWFDDFDKPMVNLRAHSPKLFLEDISMNVIVRSLADTDPFFNPDASDRGHFQEWNQWQRGDRDGLPGDERDT